MHRLARVFLCFATLALACTPPKDTPPAGTPDGGFLPDPAPQVSRFDVHGAILRGAPKSVLTGEHTVVVGTQPMPVDPRWFGEPEAATETGAWLHGGLAVQDTSTGHVRVYQWQDGLPRFHIQDEFTDWGEGTAPVFSLAWIDRDAAFAAATWNRLVKATRGTDGAWTFIHLALRAPGETADANLTSVTTFGGLLYVGSDQGVAVVDPATLGVQRWVSTGATGGAKAVYALAVSEAAGPKDADFLGILLGPPTTAQPSVVAVLKAGETTPQVLTFPPGTKPLSLGGMPGALVVGVVKADGKGALWSYRRPAIGGPTFAETVSPDALGATTWGQIVPNRLAYDGTHGQLLVGGILGAGRGLVGAGLVSLDAAPDGTLTGAAHDVVGSRDPLRPLVPWMVDVLAVDAEGRWLVGGRQLCSEHKLRQAGLWRLEPGEKGLKFARLWTAGAHDTVPDPAGGAAWIGMRDENPGVQCDGAWIAQGACRLKADGSCELDPAATNQGESAISGAPGVVSIAFGDPANHAIAMATRRDATFLRLGDAVSSPQTQIDPGVGLPMTRAAWGPGGDLWLASEMRWDDVMGDGIDPVKVNDRGPHGLGLLPLSGGTKGSRRYVRVASDQAGLRDVAGLPSNTVWDVLPLSGTRRALVACGVERSEATYDHMMGEPAPNGVKGGVALIEDQDVRPLAAPAGTTFGDVVGVAAIDDDDFVALDADAGLFTVHLANKSTEKRVAAPWKAPERGLSLARDASGRIAVGTTTGLWVFSKGGTAKKVEGSESLGFVWRVRFFDDGVLFASTDAGVVRVALDGAALPAALGPTGPQDAQLNVPDPCGGGAGCVCRPGLNDCGDGLSCECPDGACTCAPIDPCLNDPGKRGCSCTAGVRTCEGTLTCLCDGDACACDVDPAACADGACTCSATSDCPTNWVCNPAVSACEEKHDEACDRTCSCSTESGCSAGKHCQSGFAGRSCVPD